MINDGNRSKVDCRLCSVTISRGATGSSCNIWSSIINIELSMRSLLAAPGRNWRCAKQLMLWEAIHRKSCCFVATAGGWQWGRAHTCTNVLFWSETKPENHALHRSNPNPNPSYLMHCTLRQPISVIMSEPDNLPLAIANVQNCSVMSTIS